MFRFKTYLAVIVAGLSFGASGLQAATQPQTFTVCTGNPVPQSWFIVSYLWLDVCRIPSVPQYNGNVANVNAFVMTPLPAVIPTPIDTTPTPWLYDVVPGPTTSLTLFRTNNQKQQLCKVSMTTTAASFACADVVPTILSLADLLKK
ncbi:MAG: hypothetical protein QOC81_4067 [Thermoanaerobaculia bacterium]|jgi:hypothetical protein|nr:hypothetical protein [Thermoanaerobaculia bacterium]